MIAQKQLPGRIAAIKKTNLVREQVINSPIVATSALPENHSSRFIQVGGASSEYELKSALDAYEVEELACHDLARFLPTIALAGDNQAEPIVASPEAG